MNQERKRVEVERGRCLVSVLGDITLERVDAIVNAANERLAHGGGVAGAIVRRGGPSIQEESARLAPVPTGSAVVTGAGRLPCRWVIHAVGPIWQGGSHGEAGLLESAVRSALEAASRLGCRTVSMPAISCGIFGYPPDQAVPIIVSTVVAFFRHNPSTTLSEVRFCNLLEDLAKEFEKAMDAI